MKITSVHANNRRRSFSVRTRGGVFEFPYAKSDPAPGRGDKVAEVCVDPELGREAFTYRLESGAEGSVHIDSVLEFNEDPLYMADLVLYKLGVAAARHMKNSGMSTRQVSEALNTSPTQLYRLLDPNNHTKPLRQVVALFEVLGCEVDFTVTEKA